MNYDDFYNRLPKKLIFFSFILAMVIDFIPFSGSLYWLPEFTALILIYWLITRPKYINIGMAFIIGLLVDIGTVSPLGAHSLAYVISSYLIVVNHRQFVMHNYGFQTVLVLLALLCNELILMTIRLITEQRFSGWLIFLAPILGALIWPILNKIMHASIQNKRKNR